MGEALQSGKKTSPTANTTPLHLLAAIILGTPFDTSSTRVIASVSSAEKRAARLIKSGRAPVEKRALLPYLELYTSLRAKAPRTVSVELPRNAALRRRVLAAICELRHRQRAAVVLHYGARLLWDEVGEVLGTTPQKAEEIVATAASRIAESLGRPVDLSILARASRTTKRRHAVVPPVPAAPVVKPPVARMPRAVVRRLVAPPPDDVVESPARRPVEALVHPVETGPPARPRPATDVPRPWTLELVRADERAPATGGAPSTGPRAAPPGAPKHRAGRRITARRLALAAAIVALAVIGINPAPAGAPKPAPPATAATDVVAPVAGTEPRVVSVAAVTEPRVVVVRAGDSLWAIASRTLGEPRRWPEIWSLNLGRVMVAGEVFVDPDLIRPGWRLRLPER